VVPFTPAGNARAYINPQAHRLAPDGGEHVAHHTEHWCFLAYRGCPWCHGASAFRSHELLLVVRTIDTHPSAAVCLILRLVFRQRGAQRDERDIYVPCFVNSAPFGYGAARGILVIVDLVGADRQGIQCTSGSARRALDGISKAGRAFPGESDAKPFVVSRSQRSSPPVAEEPPHSFCYNLGGMLDHSGCSFRCIDDPR
jgi:hypothetical protein